MSGRDAAGGAAYNMCRPVRSKKMAGLGIKGQTVATGHLATKMVRIGLMASSGFTLGRREFLTGLGAAALGSAFPAVAAAQGRTALALRVNADRISLRPGGPETPVWWLGNGDLRFKSGETLDVTFANEQPAPAVLDWRGIDGALAAEPLTSRSAITGGARDTFQIPLRHPGTFLCDPGLLGDGGIRPTRPLAVIVTEGLPVAADRDEVLLIEEWRLRADGTAIAVGTNPEDTTLIHTVNSQTSFDISTPANTRLRLRFINGGQRSVLAVKLENIDVRVMAIDGLPSEPFPARSGAVVLAPGSRTDVFVDAVGLAGTSFPILLHDGMRARSIGRLVISDVPPIRAAPLPPGPALSTNRLPVQLHLKNAQRFDLPGPDDWARPVDFKQSSPPVFRAKVGGTVVLALTNRNSIATVFHLHGHHFRLLDRLDDGWKPFWLDTLAIEPGQTQRISFAAEYAGRWLIESVATDWAAPRLVRWYAVE
jgi:FtsP/CotA-like multicopper oxidase with cupredoxin domain